MSIQETCYWYVRCDAQPLNHLSSVVPMDAGLARDPPLAAFGVTQAQELAAYFASLPEEDRPTAIFSSPYCKV